MTTEAIDSHTFNRLQKRIRDERSYFTKLLEDAQIAVTDAVAETAQSVIELATNAKSLWLSKSAEERKADLSLILSNPVPDSQTMSSGQAALLAERTRTSLGA
jgi:hypothetical protein